MLKGELDLSGENIELMELILKESDRLDNIISDFLEFARMKRPNLSSIDIGKCLKDVLALLKHSSALHEGVKINVDCEMGLDRILADDEQIRQVFVNLANNAVEAMRERGMITVRICSATEQLEVGKDPEKCVRIDFENDGPPIPEEAMPHLFEPFFTTKTNGTGLGLAIAARIVESHKGIIKVESADGYNTVFSVLIPVRASGAEEREDELLLETFACF
jgi:two-component system sensor histidine kinase PilS (NtrC family)